MFSLQANSVPCSGRWLRGLLLLFAGLTSTARAGVFYSNFNPKTILPNGSGGIGVGTESPGNCLPPPVGARTCFYHVEVATPFKSAQSGNLGSIVLPYFTTQTFFTGMPLIITSKPIQVQLAADAAGIPGVVLETMTYDGPQFFNDRLYPRLVGVNSALHPALTHGATY